MTPDDINNVVQSTRNASIYWDILYNLFPLAVVGASAAMAKNIKLILRQSGKCKILFSALNVILIGGVSGSLMVLALSLFTTPNPDLEIVAAGIAGSLGSKTFSIIGHRLLGLTDDDNNDIKK